MIRVLRVRFFEYGKWYSLATEAQFNTLELAKEHFKNSTGTIGTEIYKVMTKNK